MCIRDSYNVMTGLHHRRPGITGACLVNDVVSCELIGDTYHVHPAAMDVAIRCKGYDKIALISDHLMGGLPDGDYDLPLGSITVKDGLSRVKGADPNQDNTIAGSCFLSNVGVRTVVQVLGLSLIHISPGFLRAPKWWTAATTWSPPG